MQGKVKDANILKMPLYFWNNKISFSKNEDSACPWGREAILIRQKDVRENQAVL